MSIIGYAFIGLIIVVLAVFLFAPFVLSGMISEQEEKDGQ
jgi:hypothetical protein